MAVGNNKNKIFDYEKSVEIISTFRGTKYTNNIEEYNDSVIKKACEFFNMQDPSKVKPLVIKFGNLLLDVTMENRHGIIIGSPGTGKSVLTYSFVEQLIRRIENSPQKEKIKMIVYDMKGDYIRLFYNPNRGDKIFNPVDQRTVKWNIVHDLQRISEGNKIRLKVFADSVAESLIPPSQATNSNENFFLDGARNIFVTLLRFLYNNFKVDFHNNACFTDLLRLSGTDLYTLLRILSPSTANLINPEAGGQAAGVLSELERHTKCLELVQYVDADFSIPEWLEHGTGVLFISGHPEIAATIRPILSLFIDLISKQLLARKDDITYRLFFILDEFCSLQKLSSIVPILTLGRSKGGAMWLVTQDLGQVSALYGEQQKQSIFNSCGTKVFFKIASKEDAEYISAVLGDMEVVLRTKQISGIMNATGGIDEDSVNISYGHNIQTVKYALPSSLSSQKDFHFIMMSGSYPIVNGKVEYQKREDISQAIKFIETEAIEDENTQKLLLEFRSAVCEFLRSRNIVDSGSFSWLDDTARRYIASTGAIDLEGNNLLGEEPEIEDGSLESINYDILAKQIILENSKEITDILDSLYKDNDAKRELLEKKEEE